MDMHGNIRDINELGGRAKARAAGFHEIPAHLRPAVDRGRKGLPPEPGDAEGLERFRQAVEKRERKKAKLAQALRDAGT